MNFLKTFFISSLIFLAFAIALITAIDPYDKLGNNFFNFKTKAVAQSRENKFHMLEATQKDYTAFIIGSSAAHRYPTSKVNKLTGLLTYNYAVQHTTPIDYLAITRHILSKFRPKLILLQLDFVALDETYKVDNRLYNSPLKNFLKEQTLKQKSFFKNTHYTLGALRDSFRVIYVNKFGKARHIYLENGDYKFEKIVNKPIKIRQNDHSEYIFSNKRLNILKQISRLCTENKIRLIVFSAPLSIMHSRSIRKNNISKLQHIIFNSELSKIFKEYWDFEDESLEKYNTYEYFLDSTHPSKKMSKIILERILGNKWQDLGKRF